jgi:hypothetical protein
MKIVKDEMGGIKVGNINQKCKKLDSWTVGQLAVGRLDSWTVGQLDSWTVGGQQSAVSSQRSALQFSNLTI